jgi:hypothetical protein
VSAHPSVSPGETQELLLKAALWEGDAALSAWRAWQVVDSVTDTDQDSGRLFPLLWRNLRALGVDDPDVATLKSAYRHQWVVNQIRMRDAGRALRVLGDAGIETMVLKGAALAGLHYRDLGARPMYDVDILVRPDRARAAAQALLVAGWTQPLPLDLKVLLAVTHGTAFQTPTETTIDLHWYALWSPATDDDFWSAAESVDVAGVRTFAQCPADQLLQVCVHGAWAHPPPVRWVADAFTVIRSTPDLDWDRVLERAQARTVTLPLREALHYLQERFGAPVPESILEHLDRIRCGVLERAVNRAWHAPPSKVRTTGLLLERYRRQRPLPPGPTREASLWRYVRACATMALQLGSHTPLTRAVVRAVLPEPS